MYVYHTYCMCTYNRTSLLKCIALLSLLSLFLFYVAMVNGGGLNTILSAGVWDFLLSSGGHGNANGNYFKPTSNQHFLASLPFSGSCSSSRRSWTEVQQETLLCMRQDQSPSHRWGHACMCAHECTDSVWLKRRLCPLSLGSLSFVISGRMLIFSQQERVLYSNFLIACCS